MHFRKLRFGVAFLAVTVALGCSHVPGERAPGPSTIASDTSAATDPKLRKTAPTSKITAPARPAGTAPSLAGRPAALPPASEEECEIDDDADRANGAEGSLSQALALCQQAQRAWQRGDLDHAIGLLDDAYALILEVDTGNDPLLIQEKEDLRYTISKRILEIYSSRRVAVNGERNAIPVIINPHVQSEIDSFTTGRERDFFREAYRRSGKYRPKIEAALKEAGLPVELAWLPLIESGYKVNALSPARALGLWQFIPSTGYRYNLNRDGYIDERMDPEKATRGAIDYLRELHDMFGDWSTVLAAYNCGENRVMRTIQSQNINYLDDFWDLYERLPRETARYVPRFLATLHIVGSPETYGLDDIVLEPELEFETVSVPKQVELRSIAQVTGIDAGLLRELNAELRQGVLPENGYELRVPLGDAARVAAKINETPDFRPRKVQVVPHKVRKGESLASLARRYGSDEKSIRQANNLRGPAALTPGRTLRIPLVDCPPDPPTAAAAANGAGPVKRPVVEHVVRRGDSLYNIAQRYNTSVQEIQRQNQLKGTEITLGQRLTMPPAAPQRAQGPAPKPRPTVYAVRPGDTLHGIARSHNMSLEQLLALNNLSPRSKIQPGQK
ncbi:MAG: LysM peptidoglycan-binding domain-containing protein, partial [Desulfobacteraceae bacterium]